MRSEETSRASASSELPPAQPSYVFRGHSAHLHCIAFLRNNTRLLTGDSDGWTVLWHLTTKRPVAVWRGHGGAILGVGAWGEEKILTHGRDNSLRVWQLRPEDEEGLSKVLPVEGEDVDRRQPWLLHSLHVNSLNFCAFSMCSASGLFDQTTESAAGRPDDNSILVAAPGSHEGQTNILHLPSEQVVSIVPPLKEPKNTLLMAVHVSTVAAASAPSEPPALRVIAAYESGHAAVHQHDRATNTWTLLATHRPHTQPVLALDVSAPRAAFFTSAADAVVARLPLPEQPPGPPAAAAPKLVNTKHAGQQSLRVRSDGRILATAGWDGRARVYSAKTLRELAVLKWHKEGCYAVAFADVLEATPSEAVEVAADHQSSRDVLLDSQNVDRSETAVLPPSGSLNVRQQRERKSQMTHWLAVGAKDGKVSLWEIY